MSSRDILRQAQAAWGAGGTPICTHPPIFTSCKFCQDVKHIPAPACSSYTHIPAVMSNRHGISVLNAPYRTHTHTWLCAQGRQTPANTQHLHTLVCSQVMVNVNACQGCCKASLEAWKLDRPAAAKAVLKH